MCAGIRCTIQRADVMMPSQPSFCTPGRPPRNLSVTSLPRPLLRNRCPAISSRSRRSSRAWSGGLRPSFQTRSKTAVAASWILPRLCATRVTSSQSPCGSTMRQPARLSSAVPHSTAFLPPAFIAMLPPTQDASAEVGSTANTKPAVEAASSTRRVTAPAAVNNVGTRPSTPSSVVGVTASTRSSFSVLITAAVGVSGTALPV